MGISLLAECQQVLERTYHPVGVDLGRCVIGPQRLPSLIQASGIDPEHFSARAFTFMRPCKERLHLALYYHPEVIRHLENEDPRESISHRNIFSLIDFIEEITHGAHAALAFRFGHRSDVFHSEPFACAMEIQARVDTYFMIIRYMAILLGKVPDKNECHWVFEHVIERDDFAGMPEFLVRRYRLAALIAGKFILKLATILPEERPDWIRRFQSEGVWGKWKMSRRLD